MIPSCDHTGTPLHFHSSTTSGSASLISARSRPSSSPRQSPSSLILASISREGDLLLCDPLFFMRVFLLGPVRSRACRFPGVYPRIYAPNKPHATLLPCPPTPTTSPSPSTTPPAASLTATTVRPPT